MKTRLGLALFFAIFLLSRNISAQEAPSQPAADTTTPAAETVQPAPDTTQPASDTTQPVADTTKPAADTARPAPSTTQPAVDTVGQPADTAKKEEQPRKPQISLDVPKSGVSKYFLDEFVITVNRYEKSSFKVPVTVSILNQDKIAKSNPDVVTDLFRNLPGVELNDAGPFALRPVIRGLFGSRVLLLADGERLNDTRESPFSGAQISLVDVDEIERVEVVNGPGTVLYGTDALGGVVNIITARPKFKEEGARPWGAKFKLRSSTVDEQYKADLKTNYAKGKWAFEFGAGTRAATDYEAPDTIVVNSAVHANNFDLKAVYKLDERHQFYADYERVEATNVGFPGVPNQNFNGRFFYPERNRGKIALTYEGRNVNSHMPLIKGKVYYQSVKKDFRTLIDIPIYSYFIPSPPDTTYVNGMLDIATKTESDVKTLGASFQELFLIQPYQILTWGVDFYREMVEGTHNSATNILESRRHTAPAIESTLIIPVGSDSTPTVPEVNLDVLGVYAQDEITPWKFMTVLVGARYENSRSVPQSTAGIPDSMLPPEETQRFVSLSGGAIYKARTDLSFNFNISRAYRIPNIVERYFFGPASGGTWVITNPDLKKEQGISLDLGVKASLEKMAASLNFFFAEYEDFIDLRPSSYQGDTLYNGSRVWQWQNLPGITRIDGVEAAWEGDFTDEFYGFASATYTFGHQRISPGDTVGAEQPDTITNFGTHPFFVPPFKLYFGMGWRQKGSGKLWAEASARVVERQERVPAGMPKTSGFTAYDLRSGYRFSQKVSLNLAIKNLTDESYVEPYNQINVSNQVLEPGRNLILGLTIKTD